MEKKGLVRRVSPLQVHRVVVEEVAHLFGLRLQITGVVLVRRHDDGNALHHAQAVARRLARKLSAVEPGRLSVFEGTWQEYQDRDSPREQPKPVASPAIVERSPSARAPMSQWRRQERLQQLESRIEEREQEIAETSAAINAASGAADVSKVTALGRPFDDMQRDLELLLDEWSALQP